MRFTKMEGLGNDYIYVDCLERPLEHPERWAVRLSRRHFGVGADGLICITPGRGGDFSMEMYNADGSRGAMCGNGIRCVGKYVYDHGLTRKQCLTIDTDAGPRQLELEVRGSTVRRVAVDMGAAALRPSVEASCGGQTFQVRPVNVGNPHGVIFCDDPEAIRLEQYGPLLERHPALPERSNIEFAAGAGEDLTVRVWERGSGITLACGTGACAAFAAARRLGRCGNHARVRLPGGVLEVEQRGEHLWMSGPAVEVFQGVLSEEG